MQDAAIPTDPKLVEEMLRQRGLLATGGNIRLVPFADDSGATPTAPTGVVPSATANALAANGGGGVSVIDANGNKIDLPLDTSAIPENIPDENLINLLPALVGAGGAGLALLIRNHLAKRGINLPTDDPLAPTVPTMEGTLEPDAAAKGTVPVDGEYTVVDRTRLAAPSDAISSSSKPAVGTQKLLESPNNKLKDANVSGKPKYLTSQQLARRKAANLPTREGSGPAVYGVDSYADLTEEDMQKAKTIADQLVARRRAGNKRIYQQGKKGLGKDKLPTGDLSEEGAFNLVVRAIRDAKLHPNAVRRVIP